MILVFQIGFPLKCSGSPGRRTSRFVDKDDWRFNPSVFRLLGAKRGPHTIDRFATYYNAQLLRFNSSLPPPDAGVWMPWLKTGAPITIGCVPQFILLSTRSVIASLVPILPEWPSASLWPFLRERSSQFKSFVVDVFVLPAINDLLQEGPGQRKIHASRTSVFQVARSSEC